MQREQNVKGPASLSDLLGNSDHRREEDSSVSFEEREAKARMIAHARRSQVGGHLGLYHPQHFQRASAGRS